MKATIAVPTKNRTKYLDEVFAGALGQHYDDYEILVGDSSDQDDVYEKIKSLGPDKKIRYVRYPPFATQPWKFTQMLKEAKGEWMTFLGDDDLLDPDYLQVLMGHAEGQPNATIILNRFREINGEGKLLRLDPLHKTVMSPAEFLSRLFLPSRDFFKMNITGPLFRREILLQEGGFPELPNCWHTDILGWARVGSRGLAIFEKRSLCGVRVHYGSLTSTSFNDDVEDLIQTSQGLEEIVSGLLTRMESELTTAEDVRFLKTARQNLHTYARRHIGRAFDRGFVGLLSKDDRELSEKLAHMFKRMQAMKIPVFGSAYIYSFLRLLNYSLRRPLLDALVRYKIRKLCS
jgi:glycosyltransferase involved in cell wall biosynthesis